MSPITRPSVSEILTRLAGLSPSKAAEPIPPSLWLLLLETRAIAEFAALALLQKALMAAPRGDGHPVMLIPGLMSSDWSTGPMRNYLSRLGYAAHGWGLGMNRGPRAGLESVLLDRIARLADAEGRRVTLIGTSLGGIYARQIAKVRPDLIRSVVTLGSPFGQSPKATHAWRLYEYVSGFSIDARDAHMGGALGTPPPVPTTAIYSRSDGICAWQGCTEKKGPIAESVRVFGSHLGLPHNPFVFHVVADRLAQKEGEFRHFPEMTLATMTRRILGWEMPAPAAAPAAASRLLPVPLNSGPAAIRNRVAQLSASRQKARNLQETLGLSR
jgi:pimeloyl-ACP methyl ester carboxylesterase